MSSLDIAIPNGPKVLTLLPMPSTEDAVPSPISTDTIDVVMTTFRTLCPAFSEITA